MTGHTADKRAILTDKRAIFTRTKGPKKFFSMANTSNDSVAFTVSYGIKIFKVRATGAILWTKGPFSHGQKGHLDGQKGHFDGQRAILMDKRAIFTRTKGPKIFFVSMATTSNDSVAFTVSYGIKIFMVRATGAILRTKGPFGRTKGPF